MVSKKAIVLLSIVSMACMAAGQSWDEVISFGADLSAEDRVAVIRDFGLPSNVDPSQIPTITVEHQEEVALLQNVAPAEIIGTRAISSVYIEKLAAGNGLTVSTKNVNWVTPAMYANAMSTAGVRDAKVVVTAPVEVSGTAALTGIFKSFARLTGKQLDPTAQETAAEELVRTGEIGESVGQDTATNYVEKTKEQVVSSHATTYDDIKRIAEDVAKKENLTLSEDQIKMVSDLMVRVSKLNLDVNQLRNQLKNFANTTQTQAQQPGGISGLIGRIIAFLQSLFNQLVGFVSRILQG